MQNKFKSEIAKRIAEKKRPWSPRQLGVLVAAIAACALIVGASALSLPMTAKGDNCPITFVPLIPSEEQDGSDYLVPGLVDVGGVLTDMLTHADDWEDSTYDVMRTVNLKADSFLAPGTTAKQYTKWSYTTHVKLQDVSMLPTTVVGEVTQIAAVKLGTLTITGVNEATLSPAQYSITLGGVPMDLDPASYVVAVQDLDLGTMTIDITLPGYLCVNGADIVILVQYKAEMTWDSIEGFSEVGFPEFPDYVTP